jgi:hypothetical protein
LLRNEKYRAITEQVIEQGNFRLWPGSSRVQ